MFVEVFPSGRMGYAFTDACALADPCAPADACAGSSERAITDARRSAAAPHSGRPVRRDP